MLSALALSTLFAFNLLRSPEHASEASLAEAIVEGDVEQAYAFIRAGDDPDAPVAFRHPELTAGRAVTASPLLIAVAAHRDNVVGMLLSAGAHVDRPQNRGAVCLARETDKDIAAIFAKLTAAESSRACPSQLPGSATPLLAFITGGEGPGSSKGN